MRKRKTAAPLHEFASAEALRTLARVRRPYAEFMIETLIEALDALDGVDDREAVDEDGDELDFGEMDLCDHEPSLGAPEGRLSQAAWNDGCEDDREDDADSEPALGQPEGLYHDQAHWGRLGGTSHEDEWDLRRHPGYREGTRLMAAST